MIYILWPKFSMYYVIPAEIYSPKDSFDYIRSTLKSSRVLATDHRGIAAVALGYPGYN